MIVILNCQGDPEFIQLPSSASEYELDGKLDPPKKPGHPVKLKTKVAANSGILPSILHPNSNLHLSLLISIPI